MVEISLLVLLIYYALDIVMMSEFGRISKYKGMTLESCHHVCLWDIMGRGRRPDLSDGYIISMS